MDFLKENYKKILYAASASLLVLVIVFFCVFLNSKKYNEEIWGSKYTPQEFLHPIAPPPAPIVYQPAGRYNAEILGQKTVYLTFDDGPSALTGEILDALKKENVRATFFVLGKNAEKNPVALKRAASEGHKIANHSYSHDYESLYDDSENFKNELLRTEEIILSIVDRSAYSKVFRFPGGSFEKYKWPKIDVLIENDFSFIDWNCSNEDAKGHDIPPHELVLNTINTAQGKNTVVVLMHDTERKKTTVEALGGIISYFRENGYIFETIKR